jgi:hypothetical protein
MITNNHWDDLPKSSKCFIGRQICMETSENLGEATVVAGRVINRMNRQIIFPSSFERGNL